MKKIVFVGRSNVGKSSTIKALTGVRLRTGRRPGITSAPVEVPFGSFVIVDMPGFGFMRGASRQRQEETKDFIVHFLEKSRDIAFAVQVIDVKAFAEIAERWDKRGQIPVEIEMFDFLRELKLDPILVANKIDKIPKKLRDKKLDEICWLLGMGGSWREHNSAAGAKDSRSCLRNGVIVPFSAKTREGLENLKLLMSARIRKDF